MQNSNVYAVDFFSAFDLFLRMVMLVGLYLDS